MGKDDRKQSRNEMEKEERNVGCRRKAEQSCEKKCRQKMKIGRAGN
jgi:hypothetical protein